MADKPLEEYSAEDIACPDYWNQRYGSGLKSSAFRTPTDTHDWYRSFAEIHECLEKHLPPASGNPRVLHLGCGNSAITYELHKLNYLYQVSIDFSPVVIDAMKTKYATYMETQWLVMDVRKLQFPNSSFDVAIDKATLDSMLHGSLWNLPDDVKDSVTKYTLEVDRVLKPGGRWIYCTYIQPRFVLYLLQRPRSWALEHYKMEGNLGVLEYFVFVMTKHEVITTSLQHAAAAFEGDI